LKTEKEVKYTEEQRDNRNEKKNDESIFYACQPVVQKKYDIWYINSGCSNHMTGYEIIFCKLDMTVTTQIIMGNDAVVKSKEKLTIMVASKKDRILIHDVLFMSDLT
jgi:hypothetical protein